MKGNYKMLSTILIIMLSGILIGILISFYNTPIKVNTPVVVTDVLENHTDTNHTNPVITPNNNKVKPSGEVLATLSGDNVPEVTVTMSGDAAIHLSTTESSVPTKPEKEVQENDSPSKGSQVIITSENTMTNKEKREILTELDNTLMELLDVVNKVQTVDETRLITEESEVQK